MTVARIQRIDDTRWRGEFDTCTSCFTHPFS